MELINLFRAGPFPFLADIDQSVRSLHITLHSPRNTTTARQTNGRAHLRLTCKMRSGYERQNWNCGVALYYHQLRPPFFIDQRSLMCRILNWKHFFAASSHLKNRLRCKYAIASEYSRLKPHFIIQID